MLCLLALFELEGVVRSRLTRISLSSDEDVYTVPYVAGSQGTCCDQISTNGNDRLTQWSIHNFSDSPTSKKITIEKIESYFAQAHVKKDHSKLEPMINVILLK